MPVMNVNLVLDDLTYKGVMDGAPGDSAVDLWIFLL